ncbi:unnamed protein product [Arctia plantaginis]|uniref:protein-tyrosine-phosphatase n=1 Tax=Arctia plantaginis TaxID=874455 RepID=A0A8S1B5Z6_ARCPL|nr:unnamed protein product [Arctia plantaginis]
MSWLEGRKELRLITDSFRINSGNNATKRKQEDSRTNNYKLKMNPHTIDFSKSPISPKKYTAAKRKILGEIQLPNSPLERLKSSPLTISPRSNSPLINHNIQNINSPLLNTNSPALIKKHSPSLNKESPLSSRSKRSRISKVMEERSKFRSSNKENDPPLMSETFVKLDDDEEARDFLFAKKFEAVRENVTNWSTTKLDFSDTLPPPEDEKDDVYVPEKEETEDVYLPEKEDTEDVYVPEKEITQDEDDDCETLHDLEEEFDANFDECTKYEIISTDSPNIISRGRTATTRKVTARNFDFGAPLAENEPSTSFNRPNITVTRMLTFEEEDFEFTSPAVKKAAAKKSLKFSESPTKLKHEKSDSSIGSMNSSSQASPKSGLYTSESTTSMESGFISEMEEPFLEIEESNSPKVENFNELLSGLIKTNVVTDKSFLRRPLNRSLSFNPDSRARVSLFSILENPEKRNCKRVERTETTVANKRRKSSYLSPSDKRAVKPERPVLLRAQSENNAMIMQAMDRSQTIPDLIGDFSVPFALPLTDGDHCDLKSISCETLAKLLKGEFTDTIGSFQVIDCRYPYEYEGGHVINALNYYTQEQMQKLLEEPVSTNTEDNKRRILVFHCEFSIERGPKLSRFLRSSDRASNTARYPRLQYPEMYLLHAGYRAFYRQFPELCRPRGYTAMLDPRHRRSLRLHRDMH